MKMPFALRHPRNIILILLSLVLLVMCSPRRTTPTADGTSPPTYQVLAERNLDTAQKTLASYEQAVLILGAPLLECRAGRSWPGLEAWQRDHPKCDSDCIVQLLTRQQLRSESSDRIEAGILPSYENFTHPSRESQRLRGLSSESR